MGRRYWPICLRRSVGRSGRSGDLGRWGYKQTENSVKFKKGWFSYVGKIPDDREFHCFPTDPDFTDVSAKSGIRVVWIDDERHRFYF